MKSSLAMSWISDPTSYYAPFLSNTIKTRNLLHGKLLHSHFIKLALSFNVFLSNRLIDMYSKCNSINCANRVFQDLPHRNVHSWNTIISAYSRLGHFVKARQLLDEMPEPDLIIHNSLLSNLTRQGRYKECIDVFIRMRKQFGVEFMDEVTLVSVMGNCACLGSIKLLHQVHSLAIVMGFRFNLISYNALIDAYGKLGHPDCSVSLFNQMSEKDVISWTSLVVAYTRASRLDDAFRIFIQMPIKNTVSWTALISGFAQNGHGDQALSLFSQMQEHQEEEEEWVVPNTLTFVTVLSVCADQASIERGKEIHGHIIRSNQSNVFLSNALIDMYCKTGDIESAEKVFDRMIERDIVSWNTLATGLAQNGYGKEAIRIIERMILDNTKPNHVTFLAIISACCHAGLLSEGLEILQSMEKDHCVTPRAEHFALIIDLLGKTTTGRNGLKEAIDLIENSGIGLNHVGLWGAVLGACRVHGDLSLAEKATKKLLELEPENVGRDVMVSNIYAEIGRWEDVERVRERMNANHLRKESGYSSVEVNNVRFNFVANFKSPCGGKEDDVYDLLRCLKVHMVD
ncbi:pentatricopeptide repeat-containing protein At2g13600-like [Impatiens glandulifera]|uniref:pentatricopeptide repeat-containing protein At2g13600-like n=1 Tax=Impatiens glandulifera TaxID=253017 RepID=UPI001FB175A6|nr:pentatricopeptide repeat-containing protein At2g13600-like [Impatiens glandulifera]